jgi:hypothetical protein
MTYIRSFNRFILISLALLGLSVSSANAAIYTYDYTGQTFGFIANSPYDSSMTITASVSFDLVAVTNLSVTDRKASLASYSIFDGVQTYNSSNSTFNRATFGTDATGTMFGWDFLLSPGPTFNFNSGLGFRTTACFDYVRVSGSGTLACSNQVAGDFTGPTAVPSAVPVPAAVWLFGTALIGLVGFGKRRKAA